MADTSQRGATGDAAEASDPRRAGVGGAGVGADQVAPPGGDTAPRPGAAGGSSGTTGGSAGDLTGGAEVTGPGADAGVTSGSRATATGANIGETEAAGDDRGTPPVNASKNP